MALTTKLNAVNTMISVIGEAPVNSLGGSAVPVTVVQAENTLDETSRAVQSEGWHFNTEHEYVLTPNTFDSKIILPNNTLRIDLDPQLYTDSDPVQRGNKLYDRKKHTDVWSKEVKASITFDLPFEELPEQFRHYIAVKAARIFAARFLGSREIEGFATRDEIEAKARAIDSDSENADRTIFDDYSVLRVLDR
jgi:hypothetical protein|tara:strand:- start:2085 stop:2663 length:579 start_codon:yes stop_codon:yes gene_type:complete